MRPTERKRRPQRIMNTWIMLKAGDYLNNARDFHTFFVASTLISTRCLIIVCGELYGFCIIVSQINFGRTSHWLYTIAGVTSFHGFRVRIQAK